MTVAADEMSSVAVDPHEYLTDDTMPADMEAKLLFLLHTQDWRAPVRFRAVLVRLVLDILEDGAGSTRGLVGGEPGGQHARALPPGHGHWLRPRGCLPDT